jgi:hypothetical protein
MVTVKMAYEYIIDLPESDFAFPELHLRPFTAVN